MNLAWVVPKSGESQARNLHAPDRARLRRDGFSQLRMEWVAGGGGKRDAAVYAQRELTAEDLLEGANVLFGARGTGAVRLLDQSGVVVLP